jgi:hypothetical protein
MQLKTVWLRFDPRHLTRLTKAIAVKRLRRVKTGGVRIIEV